MPSVKAAKNAFFSLGTLGSVREYLFPWCPSCRMCLMQGSGSYFAAGAQERLFLFRTAGRS